MSKVLGPIKDWTVWDPVAGRSSERIKPRMMTIHTAVTNGQDIYGPGLGPNRTHSHFYNPRDGKLLQHQEIDKKAFADGDGNDWCVSVEHWDGYPNGAPGYWKHGSDVPPLTDAQIENDARLFAHLVKHFGVPNRIATPDNLSGLGWHRLGVKGNFGAYNPADRKTWSRAQTGANFSNVTGKVCPGDRRIDQIQEIWDRAQAYLGATMTVPVVQEKPTTNTTSSRVLRTHYQRVIDGQPGPYTWTAVQEFLRDRGLYDRVVDGQPGPYTWRGLQSYLSVDGFYDRAIDGDPGPYTIRAMQTWLTKAGHYDRAIDGQAGPYTWRALQAFLAKPRWVTIKK